MLRAALVLALAALLAGAASAATITKHANTKTYALTFRLGPAETMYTAAEVKSKHPTSGEVMAGGSMSGMSMGGDSMGTGNRHLEVQVRSRESGKILNVVPTIGLHDKTAMSGMAMSVKLPVMAMEGIGAGASDLHYGNNVKLTAGHTYDAVVTVNRETATFSFQA
jgi:hypothetical protein